MGTELANFLNYAKNCHVLSTHWEAEVLPGTDQVVTVGQLSPTSWDRVTFEHLSSLLLLGTLCMWQAFARRINPVSFHPPPQLSMVGDRELYIQGSSSHKTKACTRGEPLWYEVKMVKIKMETPPGPFSGHSRAMARKSSYHSTLLQVLKEEQKLDCRALFSPLTRTFLHVLVAQRIPVIITCRDSSNKGQRCSRVVCNNYQTFKFYRQEEREFINWAQVTQSSPRLVLA